MIEGRDPAGTLMRFPHCEGHLVGEISFPEEDSEVDWRLDLLMGLSEVAPDQVASEALRPLIARGADRGDARRDPARRGARTGGGRSA